MASWLSSAAALWRGVAWSASSALILALCSTRILTMDTSPEFAARCKGVTAFSRGLFTLASGKWGQVLAVGYSYSAMASEHKYCGVIWQYVYSGIYQTDWTKKNHTTWLTLDRLKNSVVVTCEQCFWVHVSMRLHTERESAVIMEILALKRRQVLGQRVSTNTTHFSLAVSLPPQSDRSLQPDGGRCFPLYPGPSPTINKNHNKISPAF